MLNKASSVRENRLSIYLYITAVCAGIFSVALGLIVLVGWYTGNKTLIQVIPVFVPMQYNTALAFVLCGSGILLELFKNRYSTIIIGILVIVLGSLTLLEYIFVLNFGIDELFMKHTITVKTSHPGRMAPNTATCFTLIGLFLFFSILFRKLIYQYYMKAVFASLVFGLSVVALSGYITQLETAYGWGNLTRMAVHTSIGFIVLSTGILAIVWRENLSDETIVPRWLPVPTAIGALTVTICVWQALQSEYSAITKQSGMSIGLPFLLTSILIIGALLSFALSLVVYFAQAYVRRAQEVVKTNQFLTNEISERKMAEEELEQHRYHLEELVKVRTVEITEANVRLKELDKLKSMFITSMSHELRTPLNSIIGFTGIILQGIVGELNAEQNDHLSRANKSAQHLLSLINDIIDISRIEAGKIEVIIEEFTLDEVVNEAVEIIQTQAKEKGLALEVSVTPGVHINTDKKRVMQCILNFLSNAVKFTESGGITVIAREIDEEVEITVSDTGIGISEQDQVKMFKPFVRLDSHLRTKVLGTGLGLYLTKKLATELLGGTVAVKSQTGRESTFTLRLPKELKQAQA